jgi:hypothetical protein
MVTVREREGYLHGWSSWSITMDDMAQLRGNPLIHYRVGNSLIISSLLHGCTVLMDATSLWWEID